MESKFSVIRYAASRVNTLGLLVRQDADGGEFLCYTIEDPAQPKKIKGNTRIPAGTYELTLRTEGGFHSRYATKFPAIHAGMVWVRDVPGFEYILVHIGNTRADTEGCLLVGDGVQYSPDGEASITGSRSAYLRVYPILRDAILAGRTTVQYRDSVDPI